MKWRTSEKKYPLLALGFNHRAESFYRAASDQPDNANVKDCLARGLKKVRVLHWQTPDVVQQKIVTLLNQFHEGSGENHYDVMQEAGWCNWQLDGNQRQTNRPTSTSRVLIMSHESSLDRYCCSRS